MLPKLLIWDWNGTILDDAKLCLEIENELLHERGMPEITREWYLAHFSFPIRRYYEMMGYTHKLPYTYKDRSNEFKDMAKLLTYP